MKICIVGGTGNISTPIVHQLLADGHEVWLYNRGERGGAPEGVRTIVGDRRADRGAFEAAMQREAFEAAIDMICFDEEDAASSLRAFRGVGQFVMCSTVCTYGLAFDYEPVDESHPLRPVTPYGRGKVAADTLFLEAHASEDFPVTIIKPSTTYGPAMGLLRQIAWEFAWIDRVRRGLPIVVSDGGVARHQFMHVNDASAAFCGVLANPVCIGKTYNMVTETPITWADYHRSAMQVIGREVELVSIPFATLQAEAISERLPGFDICRTIFGVSNVYTSAALRRDVPTFHPQVSLADGQAQVLAAMDRHGRVPDSSALTWEDALIKRYG